MLLSAATQHLVQKDMWVEPQGEVRIGVAHAPMPVYGVRGILHQRSGVVGHGARARSPFVGRGQELALLHERLDAVVAGQGQVVAVVGEPGMGKSRLLAEYRRSLAGREVRYVEGHCLSYGSATPYLPLLDLVRQLCAITPGEPHEAITAKVHRCLQQANLDPDESVPLFLSLLDIPLATDRLTQISPPERKARTFALLRHLVLDEAQRHPCVLAVENLHWSDATSEEWLMSLVERLAGAALLVLVTYRPGYQLPWLAQSYATQVALPPLRAGDSRTVVQAVLQNASVPETVVQEIVAQAAGNPFFLEELAWNVIEYGGQLAPLAVPETIEAVLAARIDRLSPEEKHLLQTAAVIGMDVAVSLLQAVTDLAAAELRTHLGHLQTAEFLYETGMLPTSAYTFKHALTQKVAYESLLQERRRVLHGRIVEALEVLYADCLAEHTARLAHHAWHGEMWEKALAHLRQAGVKAIASSANREAVAHFERALVALQHLPESRTTLEQAIDVRCELRTALLPLNEQGRILGTLREAEALAQALDDQRRLGRVSVLIAHYLWTMSDLEHALASGRRVLDLATTLGDVSLQVMAYFVLGEVYYGLGDYPRAIAMLRRNVEAIDHTESQKRWSEPALGPGLQGVASRRWLIQALADVGVFAEGLAIAEDTLRLAEADGHPYTLVLAYTGVGYLYLGKGEVHQAIPLLDRGLELCQIWSLEQLRGRVDGSLGYALSLSGRIPEALALLERTGGQAPFSSLAPRTGLYAIWVSEVYLRAGRLADAYTLVVQSLALTREHKERGTEAWTLRLLGDIAMHYDPSEARPAEAHYRQALALAEELGMRPLQAHCHLGLGTLYSQTGQVERAHTALAAAIDLYRAMEMTFWLPQAEAALVQVEG
jgi:tetratricopeptide (TPR) repeat protein